MKIQLNPVAVTGEGTSLQNRPQQPAKAVACQTRLAEAKDQVTFGITGPDYLSKFLANTMAPQECEDWLEGIRGKLNVRRIQTELDAFLGGTEPGQPQNRINMLDTYYQQKRAELSQTTVKVKLPDSERQADSDPKFRETTVDLVKPEAPASLPLTTYKTSLLLAPYVAMDIDNFIRLMYDDYTAARPGKAPNTFTRTTDSARKDTLKLASLARWAHGDTQADRARVLPNIIKAGVNNLLDKEYNLFDDLLPTDPDRHLELDGLPTEHEQNMVERLVQLAMKLSGHEETELV